MKFICLPALTNSDYEKKQTYNSLSSYPDVKHYCNNSVVVEHNARMQNATIIGKTVLFDFAYINSGKITDSNTLNNIFLMNSTKTDDNQYHNITVVSGASVKNSFNLVELNYQTTFLFGNNSVNIIDMRDFKVSLPLSNFTCITGSIIISERINQDGRLVAYERIYSQAINSADNFSIQYVGVTRGRDDVHCNYETYNSQDNSDKCGYIDTGGSKKDNIDLITNCKQVIIRPYINYNTDHPFQETSDTRILNIITAGYESDNHAHAEISISANDNATILFSDIDILLDSKAVTYIHQNQTLIMKFLLSKSGVFTLHLTPYTVKDGVSNFSMLDKYGHIVPMFNISSNHITQVNKFTLHTKVNSLKELNELKAKHQTINIDDSKYKVFSTIKTPNGTSVMGSTGTDVIAIDNSTNYVFGGEESDLYIIGQHWPKNGVIDNQSKDKVMDVLLIPFHISSIKVKRCIHFSEGEYRNDLIFFDSAEQSLIVKNYFMNNKYQHLIIMDANSISHIPFHTGSQYLFVPFYCTNTVKTDFLVLSDGGRFVVETQKGNINFSKERDNLVLHYVNKVKLQNGTEINAESMVTIDHFYLSNHTIKVFLYNNGAIDYNNTINLDRFRPNFDKRTNFDIFLKKLETDFYNLANSSTSKIDCDTLTNSGKINNNRTFDNHHVDFTKNINITFNHNIINDKPTPIPYTEQKLGVIMIHDVHPGNITVSLSQEDLVLSASDQRWFLPKNSASNSFLKNEYVSIVVKNCFVDANYSPYILQFNFKDHDAIEVYTFNNSIFDIDIKILKASIIYESNAIFDNGLIKIRDLKCAYSLYNLTLKPNNIHKVLGFPSLLDMVLFSSECIFDKSQLSKLTQSVNAYKDYNEMLIHKLELQDYNTTYTSELKKILHEYFRPTNITNYIEQYIAKTANRSISDSNVHTKIRQERSLNLNYQDISAYDIQNDLNSAL